MHIPTRAVQPITFKMIGSAVVAFGLAFALLSGSAAAAGNASFSLSPAEGTATGSDGLSLTIYADSGEVAVNAVQAELAYDPAQLRLKNVDGSSSAYDVAAPVSNEEGLVKIPRGKIRPGLTGRQKVAVVNFSVVGNSDVANITFAEGSSILTLDGSAEIWNKNPKGATYSLTEPTSNPGQATVTGQGFPVAIIVRDKQGVAIQGAAVSLGSDRTATSDAKGVAGFMNVPEGKYEAVITRSGMTSKQMVTVNEGDDKKVQEHAVKLAAAKSEGFNIPYVFLAILAGLVAVALFVAWRWHKRMLAHHVKKAGATTETSGKKK